MRILGVDYGLKRIGIGFGDTETDLAMPGDVLPWSEDIPKRIAALAKEEGADQIVVGMPRSMHAGQSNDQAALTMRFVADLEGLTDLPVATVDEQNTTQEARRLIHEEGAQAELDALAAMLIVQGYMSEIN